MKRLLPALAVLLCAPSALAQHKHAPHEHGVAELRVAIEGAVVEIEFSSPLDNLVGFEHAPRTAQQRTALADATTALNDFERMFALPAAAGCVISATEFEHPFAAGRDRPAQGAQHDQHHGGHDDKHAHGHAELRVNYSLRCATPAALDRLQIRLFEHFPRTRQIRAERMSPRGQSAATLSAQQRTLAL